MQKSCSSSPTLPPYPTDNAPTQLPKSISTTSLHLKPLFQITRARRSLNQLSRLRIHSYKNLISVEFNLGRMCVKQISSFFTIKPHKESLFPIIRLFCCVSLVVSHRSSRDVRIATKPTSLLLLFSFFLFFVKEEKMPFFGRNLECNFTFQNCELYYSKISRDDANHRVLATRIRHT